MPYGCNVCASSFQTFLISVGFKKSFLSLKNNYKNKFALLSCSVSPVPLLRFRFLPRLFSFGSAVCFFVAFIQLRFIGLLFCRVYSASLFRFRIFAAASLLWFRFLPLFPVPVSRVLLLRLCLSCFFVCFFCYVSFAALFLLCFPERKKS